MTGDAEGVVADGAMLPGLHPPFGSPAAWGSQEVGPWSEESAEGGAEEQEAQTWEDVHAAEHAQQDGFNMEEGWVGSDNSEGEMLGSNSPSGWQGQQGVGSYSSFPGDGAPDYASEEEHQWRSEGGVGEAWPSARSMGEDQQEGGAEAWAGRRQHDAEQGMEGKEEDVREDLAEVEDFDSHHSLLFKALDVCQQVEEELVGESHS